MSTSSTVTFHPLAQMCANAGYCVISQQTLSRLPFVHSVSTTTEYGLGGRGIGVWFPTVTIDVLFSPATRAAPGLTTEEHFFCWNRPSLESESESYVTTDGQSASLSWNIALFSGLQPDFYYYQTVSGPLMWDALSEERTGLSFTIAVGPRQRSHFRVRVP
jgi:hypothetical protein